MEESTNVSMKNVVSATVKYSNENDMNRLFDISADFDVRKDKVASVSNGSVAYINNETAGNGDFSMYGESGMTFNLNVNDKGDAIDMVAAVYDFIKDVKTNISQNPIQSV